MADVTERMLALLSTLQTGRAYSGDELARRLGSSPRTLRRDVERLRGYGYPVETRPGPGGYYRLRAGRTLPPLHLDDDEAIATLLGLAALGATGPAAAGGLDDAATRAYGKIDQFLPARLRPRAAAIRASLDTRRSAAPAVAPEHLATLAAAIADRETVVFAYTDARGRASTRRVHPYRQIHQHLRWYLLAWDTGRADWRVFRADRVTELLRTGAHYEPRPLPADSAVGFLQRGLDIGKQRVDVLVAAPLERVVDALAYQHAELTAYDAEHTAVTVRLDTWQWLVGALAFLDTDFTISAPADFLAGYETFAKRVLAAVAARSASCPPTHSHSP
ncbi:helix-turn-helix transcriptional regulator [Nocardia sp. NBC_01329]|uniref:helix-turn-helix transcriptional regulator n=1 Tax=Nocardia sp. NBC_01329 TaxID=2903594 RepID=UPI002E0F1381|nr:WYL domain-containing protein [Nocardia sp. NBC_01329]